MHPTSGTHVSILRHVALVTHDTIAVHIQCRTLSQALQLQSLRTLAMYTIPAARNGLIINPPCALGLMDSYCLHSACGLDVGHRDGGFGFSTAWMHEWWQRRTRGNVCVQCLQGTVIKCQVCICVIAVPVHFQREAVSCKHGPMLPRQ